MKEFLRRIFEYFKAHRKDLAVFIPSFLLAFSIWFIHNVSLRYSEILSANVVAKSNLDGCRDISSNFCTVTARCRATGYAILRNKAFGSHRKLIVEIPESSDTNRGTCMHLCRNQCLNSEISFSVPVSHLWSITFPTPFFSIFRLRNTANCP